MHSPALSGTDAMLESPITPRIAAIRLGIGLLQGLALCLLYLAMQGGTWPATEKLLFAPLVLVTVLAPVILLASLGHLDPRRLVMWTGAAAVIIALLGTYDIWRIGGPDAPEAAARTAFPSPQLCLFLLAGFFIAHALVRSGVHERRWVASYSTYFEIAWKLAVQLAFSGLFVGGTWLVLVLGAQLFQLVRLDFLEQLIQNPWFAAPVTAFAFACAIHLTDVRPAIVQGIRTLLLVLMSWILPVFTLLVGGFLTSLLFTGLEPLWATRHAAAVLLGAAAALVVLVNAALQDGTLPVARPVRASARVAAVLLVPLTALAILALALRVRDHGWTDERIAAAACMLVASCYAIGYAVAALRRGWPGTVARVNIASAFVVLAVLLLLFSPVGDPARLSVNNQLARLEFGKVSVERFDFAYLRFGGARYGREALARLETSAAGPGAAAMRARIAAVRKMQGSWTRHDTPTPTGVAENIHVWPSGTRMPDTFLRMDWMALPDLVGLPSCIHEQGQTCDAFLLDLTGDNKPEIVLVSTTRGPSVVMQETEQGHWQAVAQLPFHLAGCGRLHEALRKGDVRAVPPMVHDVEVAGERMPARVPTPPPLRCATK